VNNAIQGRACTVCTYIVEFNNRPSRNTRGYFGWEQTVTGTPPSSHTPSHTLPTHTKTSRNYTRLTYAIHIFMPHCSYVTCAFTCKSRSAAAELFHRCAEVKCLQRKQYCCKLTGLVTAAQQTKVAPSFSSTDCHE